MSSTHASTVTNIFEKLVAQKLTRNQTDINKLSPYQKDFMPLKLWNFENYAIFEWKSSQGCQLPDFSLRSQTFCYTADFSTNFFIYV